MEFVKCPNCLRIKFLSKEKEVKWIRLTVEEELVLELISKSSLLILMVKGFIMYDETCDECVTKQLN